MQKELRCAAWTNRVNKLAHWVATGPPRPVLDLSIAGGKPGALPAQVRAKPT
jgi:hypothetical protein